MIYCQIIIIIVSNLYADFARQLIRNSDYLDRLYVPLPVYDMDPQIRNAKATKVGSLGLRKVWYQKTPQEYVTDIRNGHIPSYQSMRVCLDIYKYKMVYCDEITKSYLDEIQHFILREYSFA